MTTNKKPIAIRIATFAVALFILSFFVIKASPVFATCDPATCNPNHSPIITVLGSNPLVVPFGSTFVDPGATAHDFEDGDITSKIVVSGTVNTNVLGTYTISYTVTDSGGLCVTETRTVIVDTPPTISLKGGSLIALDCDQQWVDPGATAHDFEDGDITSKIVVSGFVDVNTVARYTITYTVTDSKGLSASVERIVIPGGSCPVPASPSVTLTANPATGLSPLTTTLSWTTNNNPTSCVASNGWTGAKSVSGGTQVISNLTGITTFTIVCSNANGSSTSSVTVFPTIIPPACLVPQITSSLTASATVGQPFSYTLIASSTNATSTLSVSNLPAGLSFATTTNTISGTPVTSGTFNVVLTAANYCGNDTKTLALTVNPASIPTNQCEIVSDTTNQVIGGSFAVATYSSSMWTASIPGATWIWNTYLVSNPTQNDTESFTKTFNISATSTVSSANLVVGADNSYTVFVNGVQVGSDNTEFNYLDQNKHTFNISSFIHTGNNTLTFVVKNWGVAGSNAQSNPAGLIYKLTINLSNGYCGSATNTPPVINLVGSNPLNLIIGSAFIDPGATAFDLEDGNLTSKIIATSSVNSNVLGTYIILYSVTDSGGLTATTTRTVNVIPSSVCLIPQITSSLTASATVGQAFSYTLTASSTSATSTLSVSNLPNGLSFATTTPNTGVISGVPSTSGTFNISLNATNSCGSDSKTLVLTVAPAQCTLPQITSSLTASATVGSAFSYTISALNTSSYSVATSSLPNGLSFSGNIISGTPTQDGTFSLEITATNACGSKTETLVIVVSPNQTPTLKGSIKVCFMVANDQNVLATTSASLPSGTFIMNIATSTNYATSTIFSKTWNSTTFVPNTNIVLNNVLDADCVTYNNLDFGTYYYSPISLTGSLWNIPGYDDEETQSINNVFDFFPYGSDLNSDGAVSISTSTANRTIVVLDKFTTAPACLLPEFTSAVSASATVGQAFSYTLTASSTPASIFSVATSTLPSGLSFDTSSNVISGTPTVAGTFDITLNAKNSCGLTTQTLVLTVVPATCVNGCGGSSADLSIQKTADKTSANVGDTVTYTITVANAGPNNATGVSVTDILPAGLTLVSATPNVGSFSTTTGVWTIGSLTNASSTAMTLVTTINSNMTGQTISNTATVQSNISDPNSSNNTGTINITVNTPACTSNCGGGGGGGGGGGNGPIVPNTLTIYNEQVVETTPGIAMVTWNTNLSANRRVVYGNSSVATTTTDSNYGYPNTTDLVLSPLLTAHGMVISINPALTYYFRPISSNGVATVVGKELILSPATTTPTSCYYLYDYLRKDLNNNPVEVKKLQIFLNSFEGAHLTVNGVYDDATIAAVDAFQIKYSGDILTPWGYPGNQGTDYTYILTKKKVNEIYCQMAFPVNTAQQAEIDATRAFFNSLQNAGINLGTQTAPATEGTTTQLLNNVVGENTNSNDVSNLSTLAGVSSTTQNFASRLTANVLSSGKTLGSILAAFFTWPFGSMIKGVSVNWCTNSFAGGWFSWILLVIIIVILALWYRQYRNNKKIENLNKEIDLK